MEYSNDPGLHSLRPVCAPPPSDKDDAGEYVSWPSSLVTDSPGVYITVTNEFADSSDFYEAFK